MVTSPRLFAVGLMLLLSVYHVKARSVENKSKNNGWKRDHYHIQVDISLENEDDEYNPGLDHTVTAHQTTRPDGSRPPTTPPGHQTTRPDGSRPPTTPPDHPTTRPDGSRPPTTPPGHPTTRPDGSRPPTTPPGPTDTKPPPLPTTYPSGPTSTAISSSDSTTRPNDWQPEVCDSYQFESGSLPNMKKKSNFKPGHPFTEEEIQDALLNKNVPNTKFKLPCSSVFPNNDSSRAVVNPNWPNAEIPYELDDALNDEQRKMIIKAMEDISNKTCIRFPPWKNQPYWMRIALGTTGCTASTLGITSIPPVEILLKAPDCFFHGTILHEILHVAGLAHEQSRRDRDNYVTILWENIQDDFKFAFCKKNTRDTGYPYDYASVMHYPEDAFSINKGVLNTIDARGNDISGYSVGMMSQGDVEQLNYIYCNQTQVCKTEWTQTGNSNKSYCYLADFMSWYSAYIYCERFGEGAQLAILDTEAKRNEIAGYLGANGGTWAWVGANDRSGSFQWLDGNPVTNDSWSGPTVPISDGKENTCVMISNYTPPKALFNYTCDKYTAAVLCEY